MSKMHGNRQAPFNKQAQQYTTAPWSSTAVTHQSTTTGGLADNTNAS
jgi:hypothetical protein